jgi:hypothetical protein
MHPTHLKERVQFTVYGNIVPYLRTLATLAVLLKKLIAQLVKRKAPGFLAFTALPAVM